MVRGFISCSSRRFAVPLGGAASGTGNAEQRPGFRREGEAPAEPCVFGKSSGWAGVSLSRIGLAVLAVALLGTSAVAQNRQAGSETTNQISQYQQSWLEAQSASVLVADEYRHAAENGASQERLKELSEKLRSAVEAEFTARTALQAERVRQAEQRLRQVKLRQQQRKKLAAEIIRRRVQSLTSAQIPGVGNSVLSPSNETLQPQSTPQVLLDEWYRRGVERDYSGMVALLDDQAAAEMAGMLLQSATMLQFVAQLGATSADDVPLLQKQVLTKIPLIIARYSRPNPSPEAVQARNRTSQIMFGALQGAAAPGVPPPTREDLLVATEILTDCRGFLREMLPAVQELDGTAASEEPDYLVSLNGDTATATVVSGGTSSTMELQLIQGGWIIHSLLDEATLSRFVPTTSSSADESTAVPNLTEQPTSTLTPPAVASLTQPVLPPAELVSSLDEGELSSPFGSGFATPQALLDEMDRCVREEDYEGYVALLTDDAVAELAGTVTFLSSAQNRKLSQIEEQLLPRFAVPLSSDADQERFLQSPAGLEMAMAQAQWEQWFGNGVATLPTSTISPPSFRRMLRGISGMWKEPRQLLEFLLPTFVVHRVAVNDEDSFASVDTWKPFLWDVDVSGSRAEVRARSESGGDVSVRLHLIRESGGWRVSSMIGDDLIQAIEQSMAPPGRPPLLELARVPVATCDLSPGMLLSADDVRWEQRWKWRREPLAGRLPAKIPGLVVLQEHRSGQQVKAEGVGSIHSVDTVEFLTAAQRDTPYKGDWRNLGAAEWAFKARAPGDPPLVTPVTSTLLSALRSMLEQTAVEELTLEQVRRTDILDMAIHVWPPDHGAALRAVGERLSEWAVLQAAGNDEETQRYLCSDRFLSRVLRTTGELPSELLQLDVRTPQVKRGLQVLARMAEHTGGLPAAWVEQERGQLQGLFLQAPVATMKAILQTNPMGPTDLRLLCHFLGAAAPVATRDRVQLREADPVLLVYLLAEQADRRTNTMPARLTCDNGPNVFSVLYLPIRDILAGQTGYRSVVFESVVKLCQRTGESEAFAAAFPGAAAEARRRSASAESF